MDAKLDAILALVPCFDGKLGGVEERLEKKIDDLKGDVAVQVSSLEARFLAMEQRQRSV